MIDSDRAEQAFLLPVNVRDQLPATHLVWDVLTWVEELDLTALRAAYRADGQGAPPYNPKTILALILYCHAKGIMFARDIAAACHDDLGARVITANRYPERTTIGRFMNNHQVALRALLPQTLRLGHTQGLLDLSVTAGDGTKALANAAMHTTTDETGLLAQITSLEQQLAATQQAWLQQAGTDPSQPHPTLFDDPVTPSPVTPSPVTPSPVTPSPVTPGGQAATLWRRMGVLNRLLQQRRAALAYLHEHPNTDLSDWAGRLRRDQDRAERCTERLEKAYATAQATYQQRTAALAAGAPCTGSRPVAPGDHVRVRQARNALTTAQARVERTTGQRPTTTKVNTTDPASQIMPGKHDGYGQRHNIQAFATKTQLILAIGRHRSSNDKQALTTLLSQARANLDTAGITEAIGVALFDNGYASEANFTTEQPVGLLLIAVEKEARQTGRLTDGASTAAHAWQAMAERLEQPANRTLYKQRGAIIEPVFAQLFTRFGRTLLRRGDNAVDTELHLWAITHNLLKISRHRKRHPPHPPG